MNTSRLLLNLRLVALVVGSLLGSLPAHAADSPMASSSPASDNRIGVSTALTGSAAPWGEDIRRALLFANDEISGGKYHFIFEDDACNGKTAASVAQKFTHVEHLRYVIGQACSSTVLGSASIYEAAKVIAISPSASAATISQAGDFIFRTWPSDAHAAHKLFGYMAAQHKKLGIISEETEYAQGFLHNIEQANVPARTKIIRQNYLPEVTDYRPTLLRLKSQGIDGLFINSQTDATFLAVLKQVQDLRIDVPIYSAYYAGTENFLQQAGTLSEGIIFVDAPSADEILNPEGAALLRRYHAKYGTPNFSDMIIVTTIEAFRALTQAIESGEDLRSYLYRTKFHGMTGTWSFDRFGDPRGIDFVLKKVRGGKVRRL